MAGFFTSLEVRVNVPSENPLLTYAHCSLAVTRLHFLRQHLTATWHCSLCAHPLRPLPLACNRGLLLFPALSPGVGPGAGAQGASVQWMSACTDRQVPGTCTPAQVIAVTGIGISLGLSRLQSIYYTWSDLNHITALKLILIRPILSFCQWNLRS